MLPKPPSHPPCDHYSHGMGGLMVPYQQPSRLYSTRSDPSGSMPGSRLQRIMQGLQESNQAEELKSRA